MDGYFWKKNEFSYFLILVIADSFVCCFKVLWCFEFFFSIAYFFIERRLLNLTYFYLAFPLAVLWKTTLNCYIVSSQAGSSGIQNKHYFLYKRVLPTIRKSWIGEISTIGTDFGDLTRLVFKLSNSWKWLMVHLGEPHFSKFWSGK